MTEHPSNPQKHWLRPLKGEWRGGHHLLLWPVESVRRGRIVCERVQAHAVQLLTDGSAEIGEHVAAGADGIDALLESVYPKKGELTVWLPSGWEHLQLTGLAELMDKGIITWRYANLDTARVLVKGAWRSRPITITSLSAWTGGAWDSWRSKTDSEGEQLFFDCFKAVADLSHVLHLGRVAPSAASGALLCWRSVLGPRLEIEVRKKVTKKKVSHPVNGSFVAPIPSRPQKARNAERHCCYGLVHRQLRRGLVEGPIYCVDVSSAYLLFLMSTPLPVMFSKHLHRPKIQELAESMAGHTGCALVQLRSPAEPYPVRRGNRVRWSTGEYWTWLAGAELAQALLLGHVIQCECAYMWISWRYDQDSAIKWLSLGENLKRHLGPLPAAAWRSVYSQLVGRFASWRREWVDCQAEHNFGRWSSWLGADPDTGAIVQYRSVAGRCQRLTARTDTSDSVPLLFGCVTAQGRWMMHQLALHARISEVIAIEADSLWVTSRGWQNLQRKSSALGMPADNLPCKETLTRAWMTGESIAIVQKGGKRFVRCPGIPGDVAVGRQYTVDWPEGAGWADDGTPAQKRGVKRRVRSYKVSRIMAEFGGEPLTLPYSDELNDPMMGPELLAALGSPERTVLDE